MIGIYAIENTDKDKYYIGSSTNIKNRFNIHKSYMNKLKCCNNKINEDYKNGDSFSFIVLKELTSENELEMWENYFIGKYNSIESGYNLSIAIRPPRITIKIEQSQKEKIPCFTEQEIMKWFKINEFDLNYLIEYCDLPYIQLGNRGIRFDTEEIKDWIRGRGGARTE